MDDNLLVEGDGIFRVLFEHSPDGIMLLDPHDLDVVCPIVACNDSAARMNGYQAHELIGRPVSILTKDPASHQELATYVERVRDEGIVTEEDIHYRKDGSPVHIEYSTVMIKLGGRELLLGIDRDITERKRLAQALEHQALHDSLTDLPNRTSLYQLLMKELKHRKGVPLALLLMDLDRFKDVNDWFGHHMGDILLKQVAERIRWLIRPSDMVARLGGDEFAVVLPGESAPGATVVMRKIVAQLETPFDLEGTKVSIGSSIGCAIYPDHGTDVSTLLRRADMAMYVAKRGSLLHAVYTQEHESAASTRLWVAQPADGTRGSQA